MKKYPPLDQKILDEFGDLIMIMRKNLNDLLDKNIKIYNNLKRKRNTRATVKARKKVHDILDDCYHTLKYVYKS